MEEIAGVLRAFSHSFIMMRLCLTVNHSIDQSGVQLLQTTTGTRCGATVSQNVRFPYDQIAPRLLNSVYVMYLTVRSKSILSGRAVFCLGIMLLTQISRPRVKQSKISLLIPHIYVLGCFVNLLVIFGYIWG